MERWSSRSALGRRPCAIQEPEERGRQSYPCKTKTSQETEKSLQKFLEPTRKPKVIHTDNSLEFGKSCEDLSWDLCTSTPHPRSCDVVVGSKASVHSRCFFHGCSVGVCLQAPEANNQGSSEEGGNMHASLQRSILRTQAAVGSQQRMRSRHQACRGSQDCKSRAPRVREANRVVVQMQRERRS